MRGARLRPDRIPPHNLDAERAMLGAVLMEGRRALDPLDAAGVMATDFYTETHRIIYAQMQRLSAGGVPVDLVSLAEALIRAGQLEAVGGPPTLALLAEEGSIAAHLETYARIVVDLAKHRELIQATMEAQAAAFERGKPADDIIGDLASRLDRLAQRTRGGVYDPAANWQRIVGAWGRGTVMTGLKVLDDLTGGTSRGDMIAIAGRTSHGKTTFSADRALAMAAAGLKVDVLALEESEDAFTRLLIANLANVSTFRMRTGQLSDAEFLRAEDAVRRLQDLPVKVIGLETLRTLDERAVVAAVSLSRADIVILDHIHKVQTRRHAKDDLRTYQIGRLVDKLHALALRDGRVIWLTAQLSREMEHQKRPPVMSDISDSASIEKGARQVLLLYWKWKHDASKDPEDYEIHLAKNSGGGTGKVEVAYIAATGRFSDPAGATP